MRDILNVCDKLNSGMEQEKPGVGIGNKEKEFESIYNEYYKKILGYVHKKIAVYQDAEDLTQEIMAACYKNWERYNPEKASLSTWIYIITNNRLKNYYRDKKWSDSIDDENTPIAIISGESIEEAVLMEEMKSLLLSSFSLLTEREERIVKAKFYECKSSGEIAEELQLTSGNVRVILNRAVNKIYSYFKQNGYDKNR